jgi:hypothetical protein
MCLTEVDMKRALKLSIIGAAIAGAAVGTVAFLRSRKGAGGPEMLDYDEATKSVGDAVSSATDSASDAAAGLKAAASEAVDS